jgi:hypothetical protein
VGLGGYRLLTTNTTLRFYSVRIRVYNVCIIRIKLGSVFFIYSSLESYRSTTQKELPSKDKRSIKETKEPKGKGGLRKKVVIKTAKTAIQTGYRNNLREETKKGISKKKFMGLVSTTLK